MAFPGKRLLPIIGIFTLPTVKHVGVDIKAPCHLACLVPAFGNHLYGRKLKILVKTLMLTHLPFHMTPPVLETVVILPLTLHCVHFFGGRSFALNRIRKTTTLECPNY